MGLESGYVVTIFLKDHRKSMNKPPLKDIYHEFESYFFISHGIKLWASHDCQKLVQNLFVNIG